MRIFDKWSGDNGIEKFIIEQTGCKPYSGAGICYRKKNKVTILRSVEDTYYYDDNLSDENNPIYTLFGHYGDQDEKEAKFNEPFLNEEKTKHIYLYSKTTSGKYVWYGEYYIKTTSVKNHIGKDRNPRKIVLVHLSKKI